MWSVLVATALIAAPGPQVEVRTLDEKSAVGELIALDAQQAVVQTAGGRASFAISNLHSIALKAGAPSSEKPVASVELVDRSRLSAKDLQVTQGVAKITLPGGHSVDVAIKVIRAARFRDPAESNDALSSQWSEILRAPATGDVLVIRKAAALDFLTGVIGEVDAQNVKFELDKEPLTIKRDKVEGLVYFHSTEPALADPMCEVVAADGSRLRAASVGLADSTLKITTVAGLELSLPLAASSRLDFSAGNMLYLSDLEAESIKTESYFGLKEDLPALKQLLEPRRDIGFDQGPLTLDGRTYSKGLALHSRTLAVYRLPGSFPKLKTIVGIDDAAPEGGSVKVEIKGDAKLLWEATVQAGEKSQPVEIDVAGVKRLQILVDFGDNLDLGDQLDLCEARLTK